MLRALVTSQLGAERAATLLDGLVVGRAQTQAGGDEADRAVIAEALAVVLLDDLLGRVPGAAAYVEDRWAHGRRVELDHLGVRTVTGVACGELAEGRESVVRLLRPLGDVHRNAVAELPADRFSEPFTAAAARVVGSSHDPLTRLAQVNLDRLATAGRLPRSAAESLLGELAGCFARHHATPTLADYEILLPESAEMAWFATEGTACSHAAFRVDDPGPKTNPPAMVERSFKVGERATVTRTVPGSWFELVSGEEASG